MNNDYKYVGVPLTPSIAQELIKEAFSGKTATRREIVEIVVQIHDERGGLPSEAKDVRTTIKSALQNLKKKRIVENLSLGSWRIYSSPNLSERDVSESVELPQTSNAEKIITHNDYPYARVPLTPKIAQELIIEQFSEQTVEKQKIIETVVQIHGQRGGLPSEAKDVRMTFKSALRSLKKNEIAEDLAKNYWRIGPSSNPLYKYVGVPLMPSIAQELIIEKFSGEIVGRQNIVDAVVQIHCERGGLPPKSQDVRTTIKSALQNLKKNGVAAHIAKNRWQINPSPDHPEKEVSESIEPPDIPDEEEIIEPDVPSERSIGSGEGSVYLYYFPLYREVAESKGESVWPCKIGRTEGDPVLRVRSQAATAIPEEPEIALTIRTDAPPDMEKAIHAILTVRGRCKEAPGKEWFITNPREVEEIHAFIVSEPPNF